MAPAKAIIKIIEKIVEPLIINIISSDKQAIEQTPAANLKSIEPSDTFINGNRVVVNPKDVTVVSGNPYVLNQARERGMQTLSS